MNQDQQIKEIERRVQDLISAEPEIFLVETRIRPTNNIKVFLDGDQGVSIEKLVYYNRKLYRTLEEDPLFPNGDFSLEVSSPGLEEPLKLRRQYLKNVGRFLEVMQADGSRKEGKLINVSEERILLEEEKGKGKKKETIQHDIPFGDIKTTKVQIKF